MSTLINGTEDLVSQNLTPAAAYAVVNTTFQKLAQMSLYNQDCRFNGLVRDNDVRDAHTIPIRRLVSQVEVIVNGDAPADGSLTVQLLFGGVAQSNTVSVTAGQKYILGNLLSANMVIPASTTCAAKVTAANGASDVLVKILCYLVIP
jgi:hypothetical protein